MAGRDAPVAGSRSSLLWGVVAVLVGIAAAVLLGMTLGGGSGQIAASGSLPASLVAAASSPGDSPSPSAGSSSSPSASPPSAAPTAAPTLVAVSTASATTAAPTPPPTAPPTAPPTPRPQATPRPTPTPNTDPAIQSFTVPATEDCTDDSAGTITVSWAVLRATGVTLSIDGAGVFDTYPEPSGSRELPFACGGELSHTYTLTTTGGSGPAASSTKTVSTAQPAIVTFRLGRAECQAPAGSVGIAVTYEIQAATGVELHIDGAIYGRFSGKTSSSGLSVPYDCSRESQTFTLTTTGGFGSQATKQVVASRAVP